jgi:hypothetical protein
VGADDPDDPRLLSVAASISAGVPVEWAEVLQRATDQQEAEVLGGLRLVEEIVRFHRTDVVAATTSGPNPRGNEPNPASVVSNK